jgi:hypothetical protein
LSMLRAAPTTMAFRCSMPLFCYSEYGAVNWRWTPYAQCCTNSVELNSPPWSVCNAINLQLDSTSALCLNSLIAFVARSLDASTVTHMNRL